MVSATAASVSDVRLTLMRQSQKRSQSSGTPAATNHALAVRRSSARNMPANDGRVVMTAANVGKAADVAYHLTESVWSLPGNCKCADAA